MQTLLSFIIIGLAAAWSPGITGVGNKLAFNAAKSAAALAAPAAILTTSIPAQASTSIIDAIPTESLALEVQFGAYLAVLLGTFLPVLFLINLYIQTESRKAGKAGGQDSE